MAIITIADASTVTAQTFLTGQIGSTNPLAKYDVNATGVPVVANGEILEFTDYSASVPEGLVTGQIWPLN